MGSIKQYMEEICLDCAQCYSCVVLCLCVPWVWSNDGGNSFHFLSLPTFELAWSRQFRKDVHREEVREPTAGSSAEVDGPPLSLSPTSNHHQQQDEHSWPRTNHWFLAVYLSNSHFPWLYWIKLAVYFPLLVELMSACSGHSPPISRYLLKRGDF